MVRPRPRIAPSPLCLEQGRSPPRPCKSPGSGGTCSLLATLRLPSTTVSWPSPADYRRIPECRTPGTSRVRADRRERPFPPLLVAVQAPCLLVEAFPSYFVQVCTGTFGDRKPIICSSNFSPTGEAPFQFHSGRGTAKDGGQIRRSIQQEESASNLERVPR